jgi:hypothetical protein
MAKKKEETASKRRAQVKDSPENEKESSKKDQKKAKGRATPKAASKQETSLSSL